MAKEGLLYRLERSTILNVLEDNGGNRTHSAKALGISIRTLRNKIIDYREEGYYVKGAYSDDVGVMYPRQISPA